MKKALAIGLIVCVLAVGGIGAAFATGMNITNVGALSAGDALITRVNTTYVGYNANISAMTVDGVYLKFDRTLRAYSVIGVRLVDNKGTLYNPADDHYWATGTKTLPSVLSVGNEVYVPFGSPLSAYNVPEVNEVQVAVAER